jgi:hypothetical protein
MNRNASSGQMEALEDMIKRTHYIEPLLTRTEVAVLLDVTPRTLRRWERSRKGPPSLKIGRAVFYRREAFEAWLQGLEAAGPVATVARG